MPRIVLHPGFHKTGTSTTEHMLLRNADIMAQHCQILGNPQLGDAPEWAKRFSTRRDNTSLKAFARAWNAALSSLEDRPAIITCVDLFGRIPGHPQVTDYSATPALLNAMISGLEARFAEALDLRVHLSTREPEAWLRSLWFQNLKVHRVTEDREEFGSKFRGLSTFDQKDYSSKWPISVEPLEKSRAHPLGPAGPLLDLIGLPDDIRNQLSPQKPLKVSFSDEGIAVLLDLNRSDLSEDELRAAKNEAIGLLKRL